MSNKNLDEMTELCVRMANQGMMAKAGTAEVLFQRLVLCYGLLEAKVDKMEQDLIKGIL